MLKIEGSNLRELFDESKEELREERERRVRQWIKNKLDRNDNMRRDFETLNAEIIKQQTKLDRVAGGDWSEIQEYELQDGRGQAFVMSPTGAQFKSLPQ